MRLNHRIQLGLGCVLAIWIVSLGSSFRTMKDINKDYHRVVEETLPMIIALEDLRFSAMRIVASTSEYGMVVALTDQNGGLASGNDSEGQKGRELEQIEEGIETFRAALEIYGLHADRLSPSGDEARDRLRAISSDLALAGKELANAAVRRAPAEALLELREQLEDLEVSVVSTVSDQIILEKNKLAFENSKVEHTVSAGIRNLAISVLLALAGIAAVTALSSWTIIRPLERLTAASLRVARGDYVAVPQTTDRHEIGALTNAFSKMSSNLQRLIEEHRAAAHSAVTSEQRFRDVAEASSDWIWETGPDHRLTFLSERFRDVTGLTLADVMGQPVEAFLTPERTASDETFVWLETGGRRPVRDVRCRYFDVSGQSRICRLSGKPLFAADGAFVGYRGTASDITSEVEAQSKAQHLALHDALTGLPNRVLLAERLEQNLATMERHGGSVSVICLDLDHFKEVNDTLGHAAGDELLRCVARRLELAVRASDTVARLGGDEFVIVQSDADQPAGADALCRRLLEAVSEPYQIEGHRIHAGVSLGVSLAPTDGFDHIQLLKNADVAMYRAKKDGRNSYRFFEAGMDAELQTRKAMEHDLRLGIEDGQLEVYYQPLISTNGRDVAGVEALVRWHRPGFGLVSPAEFIPLAEETGLILPLGEWVLRAPANRSRPGQVCSWRSTCRPFSSSSVVWSVSSVRCSRIPALRRTVSRSRSPRAFSSSRPI